ncbi:DUF7373 family lipoprotein [Nocardia sp. bgisy134]|uniref:DUF7373 family lipoprotein n=1 Tax=unclassified Nocardia TaxID=2637762 RepID=UPI003D764EE5
MRFRSGLLALVATTTVACAGCSATVVGHPLPGLAPVDVSTLNTGAHSPEPSDYEPSSLSYKTDLRRIEAQRLINHVVHPFDIDNELSEVGEVHLFHIPEYPFIREVFPESYRPAVVDNNMLAGAYVSRSNGNARAHKKLNIGVLRFPTAAASVKAVEQFDQATNAAPGRHSIPVEGHPQAKVSSGDDITALSFLAHGTYVILANPGVPQPNRAALSSVLKNTLDQQIAALDNQTPPAWDDILDTPLDPDGIMRRALPKAPDYSDPFSDDQDFAAYQPAGELHFERNPVELEKAFEESGVDLIGRRGGVVYRARDLAGAFRLQSTLVRIGKNDEELEPPPGLPDARCVKLDKIDENRNFDELCAVVFGRYVGVVVAKSRLSGRVDYTLHQRAAAQYAVLAKSE